MRRKLQHLARPVAVLCGLGILAGFAGPVHPVGDVAATFRGLLVFLIAPAVIWGGFPKSVRLGLALVWLFATGTVLWSWAGRFSPEASGLRLYQQNLWRENPDPSALLTQIETHVPDLVTLQEVTAANWPLVEQMQTQWPYHHRCQETAHDGTAVLSRWPFVTGTKHCATGAALVQVETEVGRVWVVSLHLEWPWPFYQPEQVRSLIPLLETLSGTVIIAGDFNAVAWSYTLRHIAGVTGTARLRGVAPTYMSGLPGVGIGIDHVLSTTPARGSIRPMPRLGSDHRGLLARIVPP